MRSYLKIDANAQVGKKPRRKKIIIPTAPSNRESPTKKKKKKKEKEKMKNKKRKDKK